MTSAGGATLGRAQYGRAPNTRMESLRRREHKRTLVDALGQGHHHVQARGDALHLRAWQKLLQRGHQGIAARAIDRTHGLEVPVHVAGAEKVAERDLIDGCRAAVGAALDLGKGGHVLAWGDDPAQPKRRGQRLASGPDVEGTIPARAPEAHQSARGHT